MERATIKVTNFSKTYISGFRRKKVHAVCDLSFFVPPGSVVGFLGPNGSGKSTTIQTILGLIKATKGNVEVFGSRPNAREIQNRIGFVSEIHPVLGRVTGRNQLQSLGMLSGISESKLNERIDFLLDRLDLLGAADREANRYSKGMKQKLGFAQALLHDPELLLLDEPTSGLDPSGRRLFIDLILEQKAAGKTIFFSSHILSDVERICDEVIILSKGHFKDQLKLNDAISTYLIEFVHSEGESVLSKIGQAVSRTRKVDAGRITIEVPADTKDQVVRHLVISEAKLLSIKELRTNLEEIYFKLIKGDV